MKHNRVTAVTVIAGVLALTACGTGDKQPTAAATVVTTTTAPAPAPATETGTSGPASTPAPTRSAGRPTAAPTPAAPKSPSAAHPTATTPGRTSHTPPGTPWAWSPTTPPSCTPRTPAKAGAFIQSILVRNPVDNSAAWNGWVGDDNACFAYAVGVTDPNAKTIQLLVMDTDTRAQKAFTGHIGDVVVVGRFTIKVTPPTGVYGPTLFEAGFSWS